MLEASDVDSGVIKGKVPLYLTKHHAMRTCWESGGIPPYILNLVTKLRCVISVTPRSLYPWGKSTILTHLDTRVGGRAPEQVLM
jgi:hypothetical protein